MVAWQEVFTLRLSPLHLPVVDITDQIKIGWQPIRSYGAARLNGLSDKLMQRRPRYIRDTLKAYAANALSVFFSRHSDQGLIRRYPPHNAFFPCSPIGFINFNDAMQTVATRTNHRSTQLVQQHPCRLIASDPKSALQPQSADSVLLTRDMPHRSKPERQG